MELDQKKIISYIQSNFIDDINYVNSIKYFSILKMFFQKNEFDVDIDLMMVLMENNIILDMTEKIFNEKKQEIICGKYEEFFENPIISMAIDAYCTIQNIEIYYYDFSDEFEINKMSCNDLLKMYLAECGKHPILTREQEHEYFCKIKDGDTKAKNDFIQCNLKLVISIATKKYKTNYSYKIDLLDLIQEGNIGLIKAIDKFDHDRGYKFSTYATWWISQSISRAIAEQSRTIRIPVHMSDTLNKISSVKRRLSQELKRDPTDDELCKKLGISIEKLYYYYNISQDSISLEMPVGKEDDSYLEKFVCSDETTEDIALQEVIKQDTLDFLKKCNLSEKELDIIMLRFGFYGDPVTLDGIGKKYNLSRERVRQLQKKAITKIKNSNYLKELSGDAEYLTPKRNKNKKTYSSSEPIISEKYIELLNFPDSNKYFDDLLKELTVRERVIVSLKLGLDDGINLSTEQISDFLGISKEEVIKTIKRVLIKYKTYVEQHVNYSINKGNNKKKYLK